MSLKRLSYGMLIVAIAACSDSTGVEVVDLVGTWNATSLQFTNQANPAQTVELIGLGASVVLTFQATGDYSITFTEPGGAPETDVGTIEIRGDTVTLSESGQGSPTDYVIDLSGNTLNLTTTDEEFDFDDDGTDDPATLDAVFLRQ